MEKERFRWQTAHVAGGMKFYIVTPSFNAMPWLPACVRSVRDQVGEGVEIHHHVQDGGSQDRTVPWLREWAHASAGVEGYLFTWESTSDAGMYDAINRAWDATPEDADIVAHLNSDEQYLAGALAQVAAWMRSKPAADVLLGSYVIVDASYAYVCHRRPVLPKRWSSWLNCACITNSTFYRAEVFRQRKPRFDVRWRSVGDLVFFRDLTEQGWSFATIPVVTSCFVCTGANLAWTEQGNREWLTLREETPCFWRCVNGLVYRWVNLKRRLVDLVLPAPEEYDVYTGDEPCRRCHRITHPTVVWRASFRQSGDAPKGSDTESGA